MSLVTTLAFFAASIVVAVLAWHMQRRPRESLDPPLPVPWTFLQILAVVVALAAAAHLVSLATGQPFKGRMGF
jgi:hypothetical protein